MNREILFRAKAINRDNVDGRRTNYKNGDWVYGLITKPNNEEYDFPAEMRNTDGVTGIEVDYKTIGQFTGLTDKNSVEIFEGDIVRIGRQFGKYLYGEDNYVCKYDANSASFKFYYIVPEDIANINAYAMVGNGVTISEMEHGFTIEVIGNIFDNSELLHEND